MSHRLIDKQVTCDGDATTTVSVAPLRHATRTGWGGPHQRVHSDVLVFAQPHHQTADPDTLSGLATPDPQP